MRCSRTPRSKTAPAASRRAAGRRRRPGNSPPRAGAGPRASMPGSDSLYGAAGKPSSRTSSSAAGAGRCAHRRRDAWQSTSPPPQPPWGAGPSEGVRDHAARSSEHDMICAHLEEIAARAGGLGLVLDRVRKRGFHHRLRGVGPLDRSPWVTARTASRKSGIGAGQAGKNVVKSVCWCSLPRTGCPRSQEGLAANSARPNGWPRFEISVLSIRRSGRDARRWCRGSRGARA